MGVQGENEKKALTKGKAQNRPHVFWGGGKKGGTGGRKPIRDVERGEREASKSLRIGGGRGNLN